MANILLLVSLVMFLWVLWRKKIPLVSFYVLFGLQWAFYWLFPFVISQDIVSVKYMLVPELLFNKEVSFYFFLFNALSMMIFSMAYLFFYRTTKSQQEEKPSRNIYRGPLFLALFLLGILLICLGIKYPYVIERGTMYSVIGNLRTMFSGLFIFYMLCDSRRFRVYFLFLLFSVATFVYGSRIHLMIIAFPFFFYYFKAGVFKLKHAAIFILLIILLMSGTALYRSGAGVGPELLMYPLYVESVFASYPLFQVIDLWQNSEIIGYTYFLNYIMDPLLNFVPNLIYKSSEVAKGMYNVLGAWRYSHGGRIAPWGAFYYLAEAFIALSYYGIILVSFLFGMASALMENYKKHNGLISKYMYYNYIGVFGAVFVKNEFFLVIKYFVMNLFFVILFMFAMQILMSSQKSKKGLNE